MKKLKILAIYRGRCAENRGTPIRVRSLLTNLGKALDVDLSVFSWDKTLDNFPKHFFMSNNHWQDVKELVRYVRKNNIDVVIGHTEATSYYLVALKLFTRTKIVLEMHGVTTLEAREYGDIGFIRYHLQNFWHSFFYSICDLITTCSKSITEIVAKHSKNVVTMCGGVDLFYFNANVQSGSYINRDSRIIVGYAGNARIWQGIDFLVSTFRELSKVNDEFRLVILSSEKKDFADDLEVFGPLDNKEVSKFLADCDILVIPRLETPVTKISFPSKLPEYMAMGKAIIAANTGDVDGVITSGTNGLLYTPGDKESLINCLLSLKDKSLRARLGSEAFDTAKNLSWEKLSSFLLDKIKEIA